MTTFIMTAGLALALFGTLTLEAVAQTSCSGWNSVCKTRCKEPGGSPNCPSYCSGQMSACKTSGCWTESAKRGGAKHCNLKKS